MLEGLVGKKVVIESTEPSRIFECINAHYAGTLASVKDDEVVLGNWNNKLEMVLCKEGGSGVPPSIGIGITTSPNSKSPVHIPREKIQHVYEYNDSNLIATGLPGGRAKDQILISDTNYSK